MSHPNPQDESLHHHAQPMEGRDPRESNRAATPLELLFDLTFVSAFGIAAYQYSHALTQGHTATALIGFAVASFGICWAWINFTWFASAYDNVDWIFRVVTMVQMIGVLVLAIGLPRMFSSVEHGEKLDSTVMVIGYVIMRIAMIFQWLRAAKHDPEHRQACLTYAAAIGLAQFGWITQLFLHLSILSSLALFAGLAVVEMTGPYLAEQKDGGTPWHAHHIAERYGLFAIIALGEGVVGTVLSLSAILEEQGWTLDSVLVGVAGTGLTFGIWWVYYLLPAAEILHKHRDRCFVWGYGQMLVASSIVAVGAGLHVASLYIEKKSHLGPASTVLSLAIPVGIYLVSIYLLYYYLVRNFDPLHTWLLAGTAAVVVLSVVLAFNGAGMAWSLIVLTIAPAVTVIGYEVWGHRHLARAQRLELDPREA